MSLFQFVFEFRIIPLTGRCEIDYKCYYAQIVEIGCLPASLGNYCSRSKEERRSRHRPVSRQDQYIQKTE